MENIDEVLRSTKKEIEESKQIVQALANDVHDVCDVIEPILVSLSQRLRSARMNMVEEVRQSMTALREVRKFFLDSDYATEMERIDRFVATCKQLKELKDTGVLDAVADTAIRMAIKETKS